MAGERDPELSALILAGGRSTRMGTNKALLAIDGVPLVERVAREAQLLTDEVRVSANQSTPYRFLGLEVVPDLIPGRGPLAGLQAGFHGTRRRRILLLACDLPNAGSGLMRALLEAAPGWDAVIPSTSDGLLHPLCAVYDRSCLPAIDGNLRDGIYKMTAIFERSELRLRVFPAAEHGFPDRDLENLNSPEDLPGAARFPISGG